MLATNRLFPRLHTLFAYNFLMNGPILTICIIYLYILFIILLFIYIYLFIF